jgi:hypothetical protein
LLTKKLALFYFLCYLLISWYLRALKRCAFLFPNLREENVSPINPGYLTDNGQVVVPFNESTYLAKNVLIADKLVTAVHAPAAGKRTHLRFLELVNKSGGAITMGLGPVLDSSKWIAGQWVNATPLFTDDTVDAQSAAANDFAATTLTINNGLVVGATELFSTVRMNVGTAAGGSPIYDYAYWNGSAWAALTLVDTPVLGSTGNQLMTFIPPADWAKTAAVVSGIPAGYYAVRIRCTTAPTTTAGLITQIFVSHAFKWSKDGIAASASAVFDVAGAVLSLNGLGESLMAYFGTANASNRVLMIGDDR